MTDYKNLLLQLRALVEDVTHPISNYANAAALLYTTMEEINWAGFYFVENHILILGPFGGKPACIEIPYGKGVCGTAWKNGETLRVDNVHEFESHIACDSASNSEIVIPLRKNGTVFAVLDIDSPIFNRFSSEDQKYLEEFARILEQNV